MAAQPTIVIIGGGFGGLNAARALAHAPVQIVLLDRRNHHVFQPLLYQVATAGLSPGDISSPIRWILRRQKNVRVFLANAAAVDVARQVVVCEDSEGAPARVEMRYDYLIVAAGATHAYFGHDEWRTFAPGLKTLEDGLDVRGRVLLAFERAETETDPERRRRWLTFVIVGGGPTGVELAGALAELARNMRRDFRTIDPRDARVLLLEGGPHILPSFAPELRDFAARALARLGVEVRTGALVTNITAEGVEIGNDKIPAATTLWAAGVAAAPIGRTLGVPLDRAGRVLVEPDLTIPGHPNVYVIGDLASLKDASGRPLPGVAPVAMQQAARAADNIVRTIQGQPRRAFMYKDPGSLATIGRAAAVADFGRLKLTGLIGWLTWLFVHIMKLTGFRNRIVVFVQWGWAYFTQQRAVRLITDARGGRERAA